MSVLSLDQKILTTRVCRCISKACECLHDIIPQAL